MCIYRQNLNCQMSYYTNIHKGLKQPFCCKRSIYFFVILVQLCTENSVPVSSSLGELSAFYDESIDFSALWGNLVAVMVMLWWLLWWLSWWCNVDETLIRLIEISDEGDVECEILLWSHVSAPCEITCLLTIKEILMREQFRKFFLCSIKCIFNYLDICAERSYRCYTSTVEFFKFYCYLV